MCSSILVMVSKSKYVLVFSGCVLTAVKALQAGFKVLSKNGSESSFQEEQRRWKTCVALNGDCSEGD